MKTRLGSFLLASTFVGIWAAAQDRGGAGQDSSKVAANCATCSAGIQVPGMPQPSPEMGRLVKALSGAWSIAISVEPNDRMPKVGLGNGEEVWRPGPGGLSLLEDYHSTGDEGEITGFGVAWWDASAERFQVAWCDSTNPTSCTVMKHGAKWEGEKVVALDEWDESGKGVAFKEVFSDITENSFTQILYQGEPGSELKRLVTIHATRKTAPPITTTGASTPEVLTAVAAAKTITVPAVRAHMRFLSDSLLEGRDTGSRGYDLAAAYVASQLESMGVQPAGENGTYFQKVPLRKAINEASKSSLALVRGAEEVQLKDGSDYVFFADLDHTESSVEAPIAFVGYGVTAPELNYDDYAGADVRGKLVAMLGNAPARFPSIERAYYADGITKVRNAVAHGAVGVLGLSLPEDEKDSPWQWAVPQVRAGGRDWLERGAPHHQFPELRAGAALSVRGSQLLFSGAPRTLEQVSAIAHGDQPQAFPLSWSARIHTVNSHQAIESRNVVGKIQGSDPELSDQYVIYSAHLDHLGLCPPVEGHNDTVCHGTVDNASGVATILEIARAYTKLPQPPRRSVLFLFPTGEEGNLEGSDYFAHFPTVPGKQLVADINLDVAPGMRYPCKDLNAIGGEHSSLNRSAEWAAQLTGYIITPDPVPEQNLFIRSDQYSFVQQGIPSVLIRNGADGGDVVKKWLRTRYHTPLDNMEQPIDYEAGVKAAGMAMLMGYEVAQQDQPPTWNKDDFFGTRFGPNTSNPLGQLKSPPDRSSR
ncbi:MAG TPA: M28 family peptidase [Terriglobia bacterium]|nr:M28 family peptidase [Terriglobia bacterium]